ncbi:G-protein complex alpha subunit GpaA/FadA [Rhizoclosmatium globosum]|uniref:G-protein complex alpha subunit GpaA/FadA n=1 Tax=Rhizoclosmatium globosum TaxID=329046 RepID=A0A1Y2CZ91_9FUNG|nr:G-protein complex alpha subunit GpaA/FadA [Rhizoclosmatium globosum]|eukprot:ORY51665.1 G-protein complex alpha subunit GpaA/FadA [Rhizoclosmatium globosum]
MGNCVSAEAAAAAAASKEIDKALKLELKATEQNIKLLLLGAGETGKSTVLKQIKLIHGTGYVDEDRIAYRVTILTNIITCAKTLLNAMEVLKIPFGFDPSTVDVAQLQVLDSMAGADDSRSETGSVGEGEAGEDEPKKDVVEGQLSKHDDPIARAAAQSYLDLLNTGETQVGPLWDAAAIIHASPMGFGIGEPIPKNVVDAIALIWRDSGVQYCYRRANEYQLIDCCAVFLNDLDRLCHPTFMPTDQDILNSRVMTTTISETKFKIEGIIFRVFDVGGQRSERKKWAPYFDDINAIIYLVAINSYDQICFEDNSTNRMVESLNLFASICNHPMFKKTAMIIFMNKIDLFRAKLETTLISDYFPTYEGPNDYDNGSEYFATRFLSLNKYEKKIYVHFTWATDTKQIKTVLAIVNQIILR